VRGRRRRALGPPRCPWVSAWRRMRRMSGRARGISVNMTASSRSRRHRRGCWAWTTVSL
jgi:hypothetical protein